MGTLPYLLYSSELFRIFVILDIFIKPFFYRLIFLYSPRL